MIAVDHAASRDAVEDLLQTAASRGGATGEVVHLVSVVPREHFVGLDERTDVRDRVDPFSGGFLPVDRPKRPRERYAMAPELRERQRAALRLLANEHLADVQHREHVEIGGDVAGSIVAAARRLRADTIMVGAPSHGRLHRAIHGSVTHELIERASVPVVVVGRRLTEPRNRVNARLDSESGSSPTDS